MSRKKKRIPYKKERSLLSDVLPYEVPVSFSNRHFYAFVLRHKISFEGNSITWKKAGASLDRIVHLLFSLPLNPDRLSDEAKTIGNQQVAFRRYNLGGKKIPQPPKFLTPFAYKIDHKENEFRELCVPHPRSQISVVRFYDRCKESILYYTSLSSFTIRAPARLSKFAYHKDKLHYDRLDKGASLVEEEGHEYESLKSFFVYREYSNIYKFFESHRYHRAEKKYNQLVKLDISKCFDSIYTHSITWALLGKEALKESLQESKNSLSGRFDSLMQHMNLGETNGIIIGPEFSRIFAEIILQAVDRELEAKLRPLAMRVDYEIYRYVDDYFVFYNSEAERTTIISTLQIILKKYKLSLNSSKAITYKKPIITEITMAKQQIAVLLEEKLRFHASTIETVDGNEKKTAGFIYVNANALITAFKTIIHNCHVDYKDMLNYTLAIVERKCAAILTSYLSVDPLLRPKTQVVSAILGILEFVFFIYSVSPRVNTTIRLCLILREILAFMKAGHVTVEQKQLVYKDIYDNLCFILKKNKTSEHTQVETLYLLIALSELGREFWLEEKVLEDYLGIFKENSAKPNYFTITVALFYMRNKVRYKALRERIIDCAIDCIKSRSQTCHKEAELIFLLFDILSCPYIGDDKKRLALHLFGVADLALANDMINFQDEKSQKNMWFTNWGSFDFGKELDAKRSQEVY